MKSGFNRSILALAAVVVVAGASQANAQQKPLHSYQSGTKEFWTHPPDDWFLGDETEAQKGLAPPSGPPTGASDAELASLMKKIKLPPGFKIEVYASNVLAARQMAWGDKGTLFVGSFGLGNVYAIKDNGGKKEVKTVLKGLTMPTGLAFMDGSLYVVAVIAKAKLTHHAQPWWQLDLFVATAGVAAVVVLGPGAEDDPEGAADPSWPVARTGPDAAQADTATANVRALSNGRARAWRTVIGAPLCPLDPRSSQLGPRKSRE